MEIKRQELSLRAKKAFDMMSKGMRLFVELDKPKGRRMRYATITFAGDRCKPTEIQVRYRAKNKVENGK